MSFLSSYQIILVLLYSQTQWQTPHHHLPHCVLIDCHSLDASLTFFGNRSSFCNMAFLISSIIFPFRWQSAMYRKSKAKNSSTAFSFAYFNCSIVGFVTPFLLSTAFAPCSDWPIVRPNCSHTCHIAMNWSWKLCADCPLSYLIWNRLIVYMTWLWILCSSSLPFEYMYCFHLEQPDGVPSTFSLCIAFMCLPFVHHVRITKWY